MPCASCTDQTCRILAENGFIVASRVCRTCKENSRMKNVFVQISQIFGTTNPSLTRPWSVLSAAMTRFLTNIKKSSGRTILPRLKS